MSVTVAIVGCGGIARCHIHGFQQVPDAEVVAICDPQEGRAQACAARYGSRAYSSVVDMLESEGPDLVDVCVPATDRDVPVIQSVERDFITLTEAPLFAARGQFAVMPDDVPIARRMLDAADAGGGELFTALSYRFGEGARRLKAMIDAGELGELLTVHARAELGCWPDVIDLLRWLCGEIVGVAAARRGPEEASTRAGTLRFEHGAVGTLLGTGVGPACRDALRIEWDGSAGSAVLRGIAGGLEVASHAGRWRTVVEPAADGPHGGLAAAVDAQIAALCDHVRDGLDVPNATGLDGLRALQVDAAFALAAQRATWVDPLSDLH